MSTQIVHKGARTLLGYWSNYISLHRNPLATYAYYARSRLYYGTTLASTFTIVLEEYAWDAYVCTMHTLE